MPQLNRSVIANLESGRRSNVSIEEVLVLAYVLNVAPVHLFVPVDGFGLRVTPTSSVSGVVAREWVRGNFVLPAQDARRYVAEVPDEECEPPPPKSRRAANDAELEQRFMEETGGQIIRSSHEGGAD